MVKITLLSAVVLGFIGCDSGGCCESAASDTKAFGHIVPNGTWEKQDIEIPKLTLAPKGDLTPKGDKITPDAKPPVAVIYTNKQDIDTYRTKTCKPVKFSAEGSHDDPDGNDENLKYNWEDRYGNILSNDEKFKHKFSKKGLYEVTLTVTDEDNLTASDKVCILSGIDIDNMPLVADAGKDQVVAKGESVTFSGRAVCRDDIASYEWKEGDNKLSEKPTFSTSKLPSGTHRLKLIVTDFAGNKTCDRVKVTVK